MERWHALIEIRLAFAGRAKGWFRRMKNTGGEPGLAVADVAAAGGGDAMAAPAALPATVSPQAAARLEAVVAEHQSGLLQYVSRFLNREEAAQDVVQEVFIRFCRVWTPAVCPPEQLRFWLYRLAHNAAVDHIRKESRMRKLHQDHADLDLATDKGAVAETERRQKLVLAHVHKLDPAEQQVLILRLQEGFSYREISQITNRTEGNVGCLLHHAVKNLSLELKKVGVI